MSEKVKKSRKAVGHIAGRDKESSEYLWSLGSLILELNGFLPRGKFKS